MQEPQPGQNPGPELSDQPKITDLASHRAQAQQRFTEMMESHYGRQPGVPYRLYPELFLVVNNNQKRGQIQRTYHNMHTLNGSRQALFERDAISIHQLPEKSPTPDSAAHIEEIQAVLGTRADSSINPGLVALMHGRQLRAFFDQGTGELSEFIFNPNTLNTDLKQKFRVDGGALQAVRDGRELRGIRYGDAIVNFWYNPDTKTYQLESWLGEELRDQMSIKPRIDLVDVREKLAPTDLFADPFEAKPENDHFWAQADLIRRFGIDWQRDPKSR